MLTSLAAATNPVPIADGVLDGFPIEPVVADRIGVADAIVVSRRIGHRAGAQPVLPVLLAVGAHEAAPLLPKGGITLRAHRIPRVPERLHNGKRLLSAPRPASWARNAGQ